MWRKSAAVLAVSATLLGSPEDTRPPPWEDVVVSQDEVLADTIETRLRVLEQRILYARAKPRKEKPYHEELERLFPLIQTYFPGVSLSTPALRFDRPALLEYYIETPRDERLEQIYRRILSGGYVGMWKQGLLMSEIIISPFADTPPTNLIAHELVHGFHEQAILQGVLERPPVGYHRAVREAVAELFQDRHQYNDLLWQRNLLRQGQHELEQLRYHVDSDTESLCILHNYKLYPGLLKVWVGRAVLKDIDQQLDSNEIIREVNAFTNKIPRIAEYVLNCPR